MDSIALALGGGGIRGIAHIGVIRCLEQAGFQIGAIAGTSSGAVVGSVYAAGYSPDEISELLTGLGSKDFFRRSPHDGPSLMGLSGVKRLLSGLLGSQTFDELVIPFACTAVDIRTEQEIVVNHGSLLDAVQASAAVPGIFPPIRINNMELVDGGVLDPVPVSITRWLAPSLPVVAVCLHPVPETWAELPVMNFVPPPPIPQPLLDQIARLRYAQAFRIFAQSMDMTSRMLAEVRMQVDRPDVIIRPDVGAFGILDHADPALLIQKGEEAAAAAIPEIRKAFNLNSRVSRIFRSPRKSGKITTIMDTENNTGENGNGAE